MRHNVVGGGCPSEASTTDRNVVCDALCWARSNPLAVLAVLFTWFAETGIFYLVLHDPMLGYCDNLTWEEPPRVWIYGPICPEVRVTWRILTRPLRSING